LFYNYESPARAFLDSIRDRSGPHALGCSGFLLWNRNPLSSRKYTRLDTGCSNLDHRVAIATSSLTAVFPEHRRRDARGASAARAGGSELVPYHPIQERVELVRIGPEIEHGDQRDQDQEDIQSMFGDFPRAGHSVGI
jgi:hypothetical protein